MEEGGESATQTQEVGQGETHQDAPLSQADDTAVAAFAPIVPEQRQEALSQGEEGSSSVSHASSSPAFSTQPGVQQAQEEQAQAPEAEQQADTSASAHQPAEEAVEGGGGGALDEHAGWWLQVWLWCV